MNAVVLACCHALGLQCEVVGFATWFAEVHFVPVSLAADAADVENDVENGNFRLATVDHDTFVCYNSPTEKTRKKSLHF